MRSFGTVVAFDLDDTLVAECDYVESGLAAAGALVDALAPGREPAGPWLVELWRRERARDGLQRLIAERGLDAAQWLPRLKEAYRAHDPVLRPRVGVVDALDALEASGVRLALVSDGYLAVQRRKWRALRLPNRFDPVVFTDERGRDHWKPHPWGFEQVMSAHPGARRFVYVGDNPAKDFIAPNRLGWMTVMLRSADAIHPPVDAAGGAAPARVVRSFAEIAPLILAT